MLTDLKQQLETAIEMIAVAASKQTASIDLAKKMMATEPELIAKISSEVILDRLIWMIDRKRRSLRAIDDPSKQLAFPGFGSLLPQRLTIEGKYKNLRSATLADLQSYRKNIVGKYKTRPRIAALDKLISLIKTYPARRWSALTVGEVFEAEREAGRA
jgi:hypothetical protein